MDILNKLKKLPSWAWAAIGAAVIALLLVLLRRPGASVSIAPPDQAYSSGPAPSPGAGSVSPTAPAVDLGPLATIIGRLAEQQASTQQQIAQLSRQQTRATDAILSQGAYTAQAVGQASSQLASAAAAMITGARPLSVVPTTGQVVTGGRTMPASTTPTDAQPVVTATAAAQQQTVEISTWVDDDQYAGYVTQTVTVDPSDQYTSGIIAAKTAYTAAEQAGDTAGMDKAHADAQRWRKLAADNQVDLPDWATAGANDYK